jgi:PTS system mannose-specific IIB component
MPIVHTRIDDRLIHGQVTVAWAKTLNVQKIVVISDSAAKNKFTQELLKASAPPGVSVEVLSVDDAVKKILNNSYEKERVMLIVDTVKSLDRLFKGGVLLNEVNLGNQGGGKPGTKKLTKSVYLDDNDIQILRELVKKGIKVTVQMMPNEEKRDFSSFKI